MRPYTWSQALISSPQIVLVVLCSLLLYRAAFVSANSLDEVYQRVMRDKYHMAPHIETFRTEVEELGGHLREEMGVVLYPHTPFEQLAIIGVNVQEDPATKERTIIAYSVDRMGYERHTLPDSSVFDESA